MFACYCASLLCGCIMHSLILPNLTSSCTRHCNSSNITNSVEDMVCHTRRQLHRGGQASCATLPGAEPCCTCAGPRPQHCTCATGIHPLWMFCF
jgi:hypothetical protein